MVSDDEIQERDIWSPGYYVVDEDFLLPERDDDDDDVSDNVAQVRNSATHTDTLDVMISQEERNNLLQQVGLNLQQYDDLEKQIAILVEFFHFFDFKMWSFII